MTKLTCLFLVVAATLLAESSRAQADVKANVHESCGSNQADDGHGTAVGYDWCIDVTPNSSNPDVLYYFHGAGGDEHAWLTDDSFDGARDQFANSGGAPTVITISFGSDWLLNDQPYSTALGFKYHPALYPALMNHVFPDMEQRIGGLRGRRLLLGQSMGGFNAAQLLTRNGNLFARVSLVCPALMPVGPYSTSGDIEAYDNRHSPYLNRSWVNTMVGWFGDVYPSYQLWQNGDPLLLTDRLSSQSPPLYVSYGQQDDFGFNEGGQMFANQAQSRGENVTVVPVSGGHCSFDSNSLGQFLIAR